MVLIDTAVHQATKPTDNDGNVTVSTPNRDAGTLAMQVVFALASFALAIYLSWNCNTVAGTQMPAKALYAFFAGMFSQLYIFGYFVYRVLLDNKC